MGAGLLGWFPARPRSHTCRVRDMEIGRARSDAGHTTTLYGDAAAGSQAAVGNARVGGRFLSSLHLWGSALETEVAPGLELDRTSRLSPPPAKHGGAWRSVSLVAEGLRQGQEGPRIWPRNWQLFH